MLPSVFREIDFSEITEAQRKFLLAFGTSIFPSIGCASLYQQFFDDFVVRPIRTTF